jgi:hypothetical protein
MLANYTFIRIKSHVFRIFRIFLTSVIVRRSVLRGHIYDPSLDHETKKEFMTQDELTYIETPLE